MTPGHGCGDTREARPSPHSHALPEQAPQPAPCSSQASKVGSRVGLGLASQPGRPRQAWSPPTAPGPPCAAEGLQWDSGWVLRTCASGDSAEHIWVACVWERRVDRKGIPGIGAGSPGGTWGPGLAQRPSKGPWYRDGVGRRRVLQRQGGERPGGAADHCWRLRRPLQSTWDQETAGRGSFLAAVGSAPGLPNGLRAQRVPGGPASSREPASLQSWGCASLSCVERALNAPGSRQASLGLAAPGDYMPETARATRSFLVPARSRGEACSLCGWALGSSFWQDPGRAVHRGPCLSQRAAEASQLGRARQRTQVRLLCQQPLLGVGLLPKATWAGPGAWGPS